MTALLIASVLSLHAAFAWGRAQVFRIDGATPAGVRLIEAASAVSIAAGTLLIATRTAPHALFDPLALLFATVSAALFAWGVHAVGPVSYTHLDVYKRQVQSDRTAGSTDLMRVKI